ncbi:MAG: hypothetical protein ABFS37_10155 [Acidobacteriota bacterium]
MSQIHLPEYCRVVDHYPSASRPPASAEAFPRDAGFLGAGGIKKVGHFLWHGVLAGELAVGTVEV